MMAAARDPSLSVALSRARPAGVGIDDFVGKARMDDTSIATGSAITGVTIARCGGGEGSRTCEVEHGRGLESALRKRRIGGEAAAIR